MSHCTKFDFKYTSEEAIVKAFRKLDIKCSTELVSEFKSEFSKQVLGKLGYLGNKQYRAICGIIGKYNIFLCKIGENDYELFIERSVEGLNDNEEMKKLSDDFQRAYIEVAMLYASSKNAVFIILEVIRSKRPSFCKSSNIGLTPISSHATLNFSTSVSFTVICIS